MILNEIEYTKLKEEVHKLYSTFNSVKCTALGGQSVYFTSEGFNHLLYKNDRPRPKEDQIMRFKVIDLAKKIIDITTTYQEYEEKLQEVRVEIKKKRTRVTKIVKYWGFIAIIKQKKLRVIVKKVGEGKLVFWSVIPFWRTTKHGDINFRTFTNSDMEVD